MLFCYQVRSTLQVTPEANRKHIEEKTMFIALLTQMPEPDLTSTTYGTDRARTARHYGPRDCSWLVTAPSKLELYQKLRKLGLALREMEDLVHELPPESTTLCLRTGERW